jgi:hypothetical protein
MSAPVIDLADERNRRAAEADPRVVFSITVGLDGAETVYACDCTMREDVEEAWGFRNLATALRAYADRVDPQREEP